MKSANATIRANETSLVLWMIAIVLAFVAVTGAAFAQPLTGTKTVGGSSPNYSTIASAIADLNSKGVGTGGVVFNVRTGHTETSANLVLTTTTASASNPVVFQRSGSGSNPRIKADDGIGSADGIIEFQGTDYVTFDGIDLVEDTANNTSSSKRMEWGFGIFRASSTNASHHITIKNSNITLKWGSTDVVGGVVIGTHSASSLSSIVASSADGVSSSCVFQDLIIKNAYNGYFLDGDNGSFATVGTIINSNGSGVGEVKNFGGGSDPAYGVYLNNQTGFDVEDLKINYGVAADLVYGVYVNGMGSSASGEIADLKISRLRSNGFSIAGIGMNSSSANGTLTIKNNQVFDLISTGSSAIVNGIAVGGGGSTSLINSLISDINAPSASNKNAVRGIHVTGAGSVTAVYNTVYLKATSSASTFGSSALFSSVTPALVLRNNILVNVSTSKGTGAYDVAFRRDGASLVTYDASSNSNLFYAGSWSDTTNLLYFDGSHKTRSRDIYKVRYFLSPRENLSFTELPPFSNVSSKPYSLKMKTNSSTQVESGARRVTAPAVAKDFEGTTRHGESGYSGNGSFPDVGADEGNLKASDIVPPVVVYAPSNQTSTSLTSFTFTAAISDLNGVKTSSGQGPRVYYRKRGQNNTHSGNNSNTNGWKYNVSTSTSSPYTFVVDYSKLYGGPVVQGDIIEYFIVAIDTKGNVTTHNVYPNMTSGASTSCGHYGPSSANLNPNDFPINGDAFTCTIVPASSPALSGLIRVGIGGDFPNLTEAFDYINRWGLSGNVTLAIISNITEPAGTPTLFPWPETPTNSNFTINIQPMGGSVWTINGSGSSVIDLSNVDRVTIDGLNTGGNGLILNNTSTTGNTAGVVIGSATGQTATDITIQNVTITGDPSAPYPTYGILVSDGTVTTANPGYNVDNLKILNNTVTGFDYGIYINGATGATSDNLVIDGNTIGGPATGQEISTVGITLIGAPGAQVTNNEVQNVTGGENGTYVCGIDVLGNNAGLVVEGNDVHNITNTNPGGYGAFGINLGGANSDGVVVVSNFVYDIGSVGYGLNEDRDIFGIRIDASNNHDIFYNSVYLSDVATMTGGSVSMAIGFTNPAVTGVDVQYNIFQNSASGQPGTKSYALYGYTGNFGTINTNDYYVTSPYGVLGFNASTATDLVTLTNLRGFTTQDLASFSANPQFTSTTDLHINSGTSQSPLESAGTLVAGYTTDIDGDVRPGPAGSVNGGGTAPDLGADEFDGVVGGGSGVSPMFYSGSTVSQIGGYIPTNSTNQAVIGIEVVMINAGLPLSATQFQFTTTGSTNPVTDLSGATMFYTGTSDVFGTGTPFGTLVANPNGTFSFTGTQQLVEGTNYFWLAYNIPAGATLNNDLDAEFVNLTVGSLTYLPEDGAPDGTSKVGGPLSGIYTVGIGGDFENFTTAFDYINANGIAGNVTLNIISDITEPVTPTLLEWTEYPANSGFTLTIQPTGGVVRTVNVDGPAVFNFADADRVIVDGLNTGGNGLVLNNTSTLGNTAGIVIGSSVADEVSSFTVQNTTIIGSPSATYPTFGILVSDGNITTASPAFNADNVNISNNTILGFDYGIYVNGDGTATSDNLVIAGNTLGGTTEGLEISTVGITAIGAPASQITGNEVVSVSGTHGGYVAGIDLGSNTAGSSVTGNDVHGIETTIYGAYGINLGGSVNADGITISNNLVYDVLSNGGFVGPDGTYNAYGIRIEGGADHDVYHNSVNMTGTTNNNTTGTEPAAFIVVNSFSSNLDVRNNIFANSMTGQPGSVSYAVVTPSTNVFSTIDYNVYFVSGANGVLASNGSDLTTLTAWQGYTAQDAMSINADPRFTSGTDLTIQAGSLSDPIVSAASNMALPIAVVPTDVTGAPRSTFYVDAGAYEFQNQNRVFTTAGPVYGGYDNLELNGTGTFTLATTTPSAVTGTLTLTSGVLDLGNNTLNLGPDVVIGGTPGTGAMIVSTGTGSIHQYVDGPGTFTFPIGETTGTPEYSPAAVTLNSGSTTPNNSYITITMVDAKHPQNVAIVGSDYISRYWMLDVFGITGYNLTLDLQYTDDDINGVEASITGAQFGTSWSQTGTVNTSTNILTFTNVTNAPFDFTGTTEWAAKGKVAVSIRAFLGGPLVGSSMFAGLNNTDTTMVFIQTSQPYSAAQWGYAGEENVPSAQFFADRPTIVDWVLVELRSGDPLAGPLTVVDRRAGFILTDGSVVDVDGVSPVAFPVATAGAYYVAVYHRTHLAITTATSQNLQLNSSPYDFTTSSTQAFGVDAQNNYGGYFAMIPGDVNGDGYINYTDEESVVWTEKDLAGYFSSDVNMDGYVNYTDEESVIWTNKDLGNQIP